MWHGRGTRIATLFSFLKLCKPGSSNTKMYFYLFCTFKPSNFSSKPLCFVCWVINLQNQLQFYTCQINLNTLKWWLQPIHRLQMIATAERWNWRFSLVTPDCGLLVRTMVQNVALIILLTHLYPLLFFRISAKTCMNIFPGGQRALQRPAGWQSSTGVP